MVYVDKSTDHNKVTCKQEQLRAHWKKESSQARGFNPPQAENKQDPTYVLMKYDHTIELTVRHVIVGKLTDIYTTTKLIKYNADIT